MMFMICAEGNLSKRGLIKVIDCIECEYAWYAMDLLAFCDVIWVVVFGMCITLKIGIRRDEP